MASNLSSQDGDIGFQIAPMVDIVFVLMLFFMACAGALVRERHLSIQLPSGGSNPPSETAIIVAIDEAGAVRINDFQVSEAGDHRLTGVRQWLANTRAIFGPDDPVFIQPEMTVRHERFVEVLGAVNAAGMSKVSFR